MTEPTHEVNVAQVLQILGAKEVEIQVMRAQIAQLQARIAELTPPTQPENVVPITGDAA